jgi:hypothetical protein
VAAAMRTRASDINRAPARIFRATMTVDCKGIVGVVQSDASSRLRIRSF